MFILRLLIACLFLLQPLSAWAQSESYGLTAKFDRAGSYVAIAPNMRKTAPHSPELRRAVATLVNITVYNDFAFQGRLSPFSSIFNGTKLDEGDQLTPDIAKIIDSYASRGGDEALYRSVRDALLEDRFRTSIGSNREQDRDKLRAAKAILDMSAYVVNANGDRIDPQSGEPLRLALFVPSTYSSNALRLTAQILATNLEFLGIKASIVEGLPSQITNFDFDFAFFTAGQPSTSFDLWKQYSSVFSNTPETYNFSGLDDPIVDFLLSRLDDSVDAEEFAAVAKGLDHTLMNLNYIIPVGWWEFDYSSLPPAPDHRSVAAKSFKVAYDAMSEDNAKREVASRKACDYGAKEMCRQAPLSESDQIDQLLAQGAWIHWGATQENNAFVYTDGTDDSTQSFVYVCDRSDLAGFHFEFNTNTLLQLADLKGSRISHGSIAIDGESADAIYQILEIITFTNPPTYTYGVVGFFGGYSNNMSKQNLGKEAMGRLLNRIKRGTVMTLTPSGATPINFKLLGSSRAINSANNNCK